MREEFNKAVSDEDARKAFQQYAARNRIPNNTFHFAIWLDACEWQRSQQVQADAGAVAYIEHHKGGDNLVWDDPGGKRTPLYTRPAAVEGVHPEHLELLRPFMSSRDGRLTHSLTVYLREMADLEFAKRTHEARKRLYGAVAESDKRDAERYRWLTKAVSPNQLYASGYPNWVIVHNLRGETFESAIDAAMSREQSGGDRG